MLGTRQGPVPRPAWAHPQDLVELFKELPGDRSFFMTERIIDTCWLHDIIEDGKKEDGSPVTQQDLILENVAFHTITDVVVLSQKPGEDKSAYLARLHDVTPNYVPFVVKSLDRICNLREGKSCFKDKRWARYVGETKDYIIPLTDRLKNPERDWLLSRLEAALTARPVIT